MAIYRPEQARLSFHGEAGHGGYLDNATAATVSSSPLNTNLDGARAAGSRSLTLNSVTNGEVGQYVRIEASADPKREIRKIVKIDTPNKIIYLDAPTGFYHYDNEEVVEMNMASGFAGNSFATFLPGVYESVTTPDPENEFLPQYFLSTSSNRAFSHAYKGRQTFNGSLSNFILLNGFPLRFPVGTVATTGTAEPSSPGAGELDGATKIGDIEVQLDTVANYANGNYIQVGTGATAEVRQIVSIAGVVLRLNYPLMMAHADAETCGEVTAPFTHTITEQPELNSITWNLLLQSSDGTAANNLIRRYIGGMVNRATYSAEEGGMLMCSWDDVQFLDYLHNQKFHSSVGSGSSEIARFSSAILDPTEGSDGIGGANPAPSGSLTETSFPTNEPYYFSQGAITAFGVTFARVRNFRIDVSNNIQRRDYITDQGRDRVPVDFQEQRREYRITLSLAMEDTTNADTSTVRSLWKELILEADYGSGLVGFDMTIVFTRGANDTITFTLPQNTASTAFEDQGVLLLRAPHPVGTEAPIQVDMEGIFRSIGIVIVDSEAVYP